MYKSDFHNHIDCDSLDTRRNDGDDSSRDNIDVRCDDNTSYNHDTRCNINDNTVSECDKPDIGCTTKITLNMRDNTGSGCIAVYDSCEAGNNRIASPDAMDDANRGESCI